MKILICGGNGGIGAALVKVCASFATEVHATWYRNEPQESKKSPGIHWHSVDVSNEEDIARLASSIGDLDWVINAVGMLHTEEHYPEKRLSQVDSAFFMKNMRVNALPTLLLAKYLQQNLKRSDAPRFATVSARVGSIEDNKLGGWYSYRCAKAALNMAMKGISIEWQRVMPKSCVVALHPGTTDTQLSAPFQANVAPEKLFSTQQVAEDFIALIRKLSPEETGRFYNWAGEELPW
ncbi:SDR family oxidoreductase [Thaumasiovibrio subtropicus]|uniref:SDR family oxidoreductase n=1 Tax=Thaumasiovibrio subtropicus TaxID=1891207 RepID=UPI000B35C667|nr:SDR family oxidoreductase [Thaumasiovibrio subtropicus]